MASTEIGQTAERREEYVKFMERAGFYYQGDPVTSVLEPTHADIAQRLKYQKIFSVEKLGASAVFELSGSPCIYFKWLQHTPPTKELSLLHKIAWNQGMAPMLWIAAPTEILLFNCYSAPSSDSSIEEQLIATFPHTEAGLKELNHFAGRYEIESGNFWLKPGAQQIDKNNRVDSMLLRDLKQAESRLTSMELNPHTAHRLLTRCIFISYLEDRRILKRHFFRSNYGVDSFSEVLRSYADAKALFTWLQQTFNGDLFPDIGESNDVEASAKHLAVVADFLDGTDLTTGQRRLWPYSFDVIPIELISSIYEAFAHSLDPEAAERRSTHYTPVNLVDLVLNESGRNLSSDGKILDLSCGSGVFLVEAFRRLIAAAVQNGDELNRQLIRQILHNQIFGIDISRGAIEVAAFSLYLTALELDPDPQPPSALKFRPLIGRNLFWADAFDEEDSFWNESAFANKEFSLIIGNPPWTSSKDNKTALSYCKKRGLPLARINIDQAFLWRMADFGGTTCSLGLILHAKPFFAQSEAGRIAKSALLKRFAPKLMINLSDLRTEGIFPTAIAPAMIFVGKTRPTTDQDYFQYVSPKWNRSFRIHGIIEISQDDTNRLPAVKAAEDPDLLKVATWGSARDFALIDRLRKEYKPLNSLIRAQKWNAGQGFQKAGGSADASKLIGEKYLQPGQLHGLEIDADSLDTFKDQPIHRTRDPRIYKAPLLVTSRGLERGRFKAGYSKRDLVYSESYFGISMAESDSSWGRCLNAILNSHLVNYFLFMTATVWGVERDEVRAEDLRRLPVPSLEKEKVNLLDAESEVRLADADDQGLLFDKLNGTVFKLYEISDEEKILIEDAVNYTIKTRTLRDRSKAFDAPTQSDMELYAQSVISVIAPLLKARNERRFTADILESQDVPLKCVRFNISRKKKREPTPVSDKATTTLLLNKLFAHLRTQVSTGIYATRVMRIYERDSLYIFKPAELRFWTRSAGLNDADRILAEHLRGGSHLVQ